MRHIGNLAIVGNGLHGFLLALAGPLMLLILAIPDENDGSESSVSRVFVSVYVFALLSTLGSVVAPSFWSPFGRTLFGASGAFHVVGAVALVAVVASPIGIFLAAWPMLVGVGLLGHARSNQSPTFI